MYKFNLLIIPIITKVSMRASFHQKVKRYTDKDMKITLEHQWIQIMEGIGHKIFFINLFNRCVGCVKNVRHV